MWNSWRTLFMLLLITSTCIAGAESKKAKEDKEDESGSWGSWPYIVLGAGLSAVAAPAALTAAGFTGAGIAAGSVASYMMKATAIFYGGGVPAGGVVATLQSLGATMGFSYISAGAGGAAGYAYHKSTSGGEKCTSKEEEP